MHYQDIIESLQQELEQEREKLPSSVYFTCSICETELGFEDKKADPYGRKEVTIEPCPTCAVIPSLKDLHPRPLKKPILCPVCNASPKEWKFHHQTTASYATRCVCGVMIHWDGQGRRAYIAKDHMNYQLRGGRQDDRVYISTINRLYFWV